MEITIGSRRGPAPGATLERFAWAPSGLLHCSVINPVNRRDQKDRL